jgi:serine/threonine protein phosphatase PrpC
MFEVVQVSEPAGKSSEDRVVALRSFDGVFVALADGAGGISGGAQAAELVVREFKVAQPVSGVSAESLVGELLRFDREIAADTTAGETTAVVIALSSSRVVGASVGDSGAWIIHEGNVDDLTASQVRKPLLGSNSVRPVGFERGPLRGTLLVASDGLLKYSGREKIAEFASMHDLNAAGQSLIESVRYASGAFPDDVSILLVRMK